MSEQSPTTDNAKFCSWSEHLASLPGSVQATIAESLLGRSLELYINPTEHCNFRCSYCYEDFLQGRMSAETVAAVKALLAKKTPGRKRLYLNWFGGEPLVASDIVLDISAHAKTICKENGCELIGGLTTNGFLLRPRLMEHLVALNQTVFQITLDGNENAHDAVRRRADGSGTFQTIWRNICDLKLTSIPFVISLRVHLRPSTFESVERLLERIAAMTSGDSRFKVRLNPLTQMGGATAGTYETLTDCDFEILAEKLISTFQDQLDIGYNWGDSPRPFTSSAAHHVCYACKPNAFLVRSDGRVCKCTVAFDKDYNCIGVLRNDGEINISMDRLKKWTLGMNTLDPQDLMCPLHKGDAFFLDQTQKKNEHVL